MLTYGLIHTTLVPFVVFLSYGSVRFHGFIALAFAWILAAVTSICLVIIIALASINQRSKALLLAFKRSIPAGFTGAEVVERAAVRRDAKTLQQLKIQMGSLFYFDKPLVLTTLGTLLVQSVNLLLVK